MIPLNENKLTPKQEKFIQNIVSGMSQREAYKEAYQNNTTDKQADEEGCKLFNSPKINQRYQELINELKDEVIMTAIEKRKLLRDIAYNKENSVTDIIKAIDTDNKMTGEYVTNIKGSLNLSYEEALKKVSDPDEY